MGEVIRRTKGGKFLGWYLRYVDADGKRKQRASKQPSYAEAKRMLVEIEARIARGPRAACSSATTSKSFRWEPPPSSSSAKRTERPRIRQILVPPLASSGTAASRRARTESSPAQMSCLASREGTPEWIPEPPIDAVR